MPLPIRRLVTRVKTSFRRLPLPIRRLVTRVKTSFRRLPLPIRRLVTRVKDQSGQLEQFLKEKNIFPLLHLYDAEYVPPS